MGIPEVVVLPQVRHILSSKGELALPTSASPAISLTYSTVCTSLLIVIPIVQVGGRHRCLYVRFWSTLCSWNKDVGSPVSRNNSLWINVFHPLAHRENAGWDTAAPWWSLSVFFNKGWVEGDHRRTMLLLLWKTSCNFSPGCGGCEGCLFMQVFIACLCTLSGETGLPSCHFATLLLTVSHWS